MNFRNRVSLIGIAFLLVTAPASQSYQSAGSVEAVYKQQFKDAHQALKKYLVQIGQQAKMDEQGELDTQSEMLARVKLLHRLGEEAYAESNNQVKRTGKASTVLLLVSDGSDQLAAAYSSLMNFRDTKDRTFIRLANAAERIAEDVDQSL